MNFEISISQQIALTIISGHHRELYNGIQYWSLFITEKKLGESENK